MNQARKEEVGAVTSTAGHLLRNKICAEDESNQRMKYLKLC